MDELLRRPDVTPENVAELYSRGKSMYEIAKLLNTNPTTVKKRLRAAGVSRRSREEAYENRKREAESEKSRLVRALFVSAT